MPDLSVKLGALSLKNPVMTASGTWGYGLEYADLCPPERLGAIVSKALSLEPRKGNHPPRIWETSAGMLNAIGLQNIGINAFIEEKLPPIIARGVTVIANFFGASVAEYALAAQKLGAVKEIAALEANISCPNVGGCEGKYFGSTPARAAEVTRACRSATDKFLIVKLTPETGDIGEVAAAVSEAGADAISLINTIPAMAIDPRTRRPRLANVTGGLSGPAIHPIAVRMVYEAARATKKPIIGIGGIMTASDAIEMILAGASAVQIGSASFHDPAAPLKILQGIQKFLEDEKISSIKEIVGGVVIDKG